MQYNIEIQPSGVQYKSDENLLEDALSQSIQLEHSCKTGDCGACSAEVLSGTVENELGELVTKGSILTCQSKAKTDVILKAKYYPELIHIKQQTIPCKVAKFRYVTEDIVSITFRFPPTAKFDYLSGQYVDLSFKGIKRSYSIANAKTESKELELHIRKVPSGKMSELIFGQLEGNELMRLEGPKGTFFVRDNNKPLILMATGTGIAPIKAIVEELLFKGDNRPLYIYWGMQFAKELYCNELIELANIHEHIKFTATLSREVTDKHFNGYVQDAVCNDLSSLTDFEVYACGSLNMINDAKEKLHAKQLPSDSFYSDAFTHAK
ncbi:2Fe-2S iron-sulfur cluster binding domain-containing protein [Shewanella sp. D64]|uniref:FAD-binding oxidoreductase n=1 Tax=unclassified Shewanella TaxID=196818 RepID=UPI0022BA15AA|nr:MULTISPECIES: FAD-binding oxidoreductase [unclassified Shewanella]MEC4727723.1 2Fe-2S iron-sulfur cluster binding domain-containing protein [Shewanella sp. D64]MEC4737486.1 2Fe-2S iron-sulfur cluster binding domain-containing protein [Shewanella sp. E94]WBJ97297.1 2Fe-2S iron-sulfur cluster binding domain-containing protein [Shewanella sp. MTB7]